ncbi:OTU domain-containing protein [Myxococcus virescens]|uniref:OTU domain-containing protein n=1 Tax=Myxococcus virescens TaxID=83456 RepID=UPI003DA230A7
MQCPNCAPGTMRDLSVTPPRCLECGAVLVPEPPSTPPSFGSMETEIERLESGDYDDVLDDFLDDEEPYRLSSSEMRDETLRASLVTDDITPPESPPSNTMGDDVAEERCVPLGAETTVSDKPVVPPSFPLRTLLWNIADLGGGPSGTLPVRKPWTIAALAHVIRTANADIVTILELKKKGGIRLVEPKPPVPMKQHTGRGGSGMKLQVLMSLASAFVEPDGYRVKTASDALVGQIAEQEAALLNDLAKHFAEHVRRTIWPRDAQDTDAEAWEPSHIEWSGASRTLEADKLGIIKGRLDAAWGACEPDLVKRFGRPRVRKDEEDEDDADPPEALVATSIDVFGKKQAKLDAYCLLCVRLLVEEGYYDWLQPHTNRYSSKEKDSKQGGAEAKEKAKRDDLAKLGVELLRKHCGILFHRYLAVIAGLDAEDVPARQEQVLENILHRSNDAHLQRVYEKKLAEYQERKSEVEDAPESHAGLREFLRIRDALNDQCKARGEEVYASWPAEVPDKPVKGLYTQDEAYGVLWRKSKLDVDESAISYLSAYVAKRSPGGESPSMDVDTRMGDDEAEDAPAQTVKSLYCKREPIRIPVRLAQVKNAPEVSVVAWHPPAPGDRNKNARGTDFRAFLQYCKGERREKVLGVVLSDLNIDTARPKAELAKDGTPYIDTCVERLSFHQFFQTLLGPGADASHLYDMAPQLSTIAKSKFGSWAVDSENAFGDGSLKTLRSFVNNRVKPEMFAPFKTSTGHELRPMFSSAEDVLAHIESFITPPQQRYGASGYDKILVYSRRTDGWMLEQSSVYVIPFPMALADEKEKGLFFIHGNLLPKHLQPFWRLLQLEDAKLPEDERIFDHLRAPGVKLTGSEDARWEAVMAAAKKLSDHMPLVSDLRLIYSGEEALVVEEVEVATETASSELGHLEALCAAYQKSQATDDEASEALGAILDAAEKVPASDHARSNALVAEAMQWRETFAALRSAGFDPEAYWDHRPALKSEEGKDKGGGQGISLDTHLGSIHQGRVHNAGGGDCLFRSLSQLFFGTEAHHREVRQAVVNHLEDLLAGQSLDDGGMVGPSTAATFRQDMGLLLDWHRVAWPQEPAYRRVAGMDPWRQYLRAMSRDRAWGDHVVLAAASHLFQVRFEIFAQTGATSYWTDLVDFVPRTEGHAARPLLRLANLGNAHYEAVGPTDAPLPAAAAFPAELGALSERRRRDEGPAPQPDSRKVESPRSAATSTQSATATLAPPTVGPVCKWPHTCYFQFDTPTHHPHALFLFGENAVAKKARYPQPDTQAVIRMNPNALGIRTCWVPGKGMEDKELAKNQQAIDEDCAEAVQLLTSGKYTTLVVPWNHSRGHVDIGTGVARLPGNAPQTWAYLTKKIDELIGWANTHLGTVLVVPQVNVLVPAVVRQQASDLHVQEVSDVMRQAASMGDDSSTSVLGQPNVVSLRTLLFSGATSPETGLLSDKDYEKNKAMFDEDLDVLTQKVESGQYRRLVLERDDEGRIVLGTELGKLDKHAPRTLDYLRERLEALCRRCTEVHVKRATSKRKVVEDENSMQGVEESQSLDFLSAGDGRTSSEGIKRKKPAVVAEGWEDDDVTQAMDPAAWGTAAFSNSGFSGGTPSSQSFAGSGQVAPSNHKKRKFMGQPASAEENEEVQLMNGDDVPPPPPVWEEGDEAEPKKQKKGPTG